MFYKKTGKIPNKHSKPNRHSTKTTETAFADKEIIYGINTIQVLINTDPSRIISIFCEKKNTTVINSKIKNICDLALDQQISVQDTNTATLDRWFVEPVNHQGIAAHIKPTKFLEEEDLIELANQIKPSKAIFLVLDSVQDPRNLGACIRSAAAIGVSAVVISRNATCDVTATVKKVASGAADIIPIAKVGNLVNCLKQLQKHGVWVISLAASHAQNLSAIDLTVPVALVLGSEELGVRSLIKQHSDFLAKIPMLNSGIDSLNLSVAAGICLYEVNRQRTNGKA